MRTLFLATDLAGIGKRLSRRGFVVSLAAAAPAVLGLTSARAQGEVWREFRPAGAAFRIEMPGEPKVETDAYINERAGTIRSVDAEVEYEKTSFAIQWRQWKSGPTFERWSGYQREAVRVMGVPATRETPLTIDGLPAVELIGGTDQFYYVKRALVMGNATMQIDVTGTNAGVHQSPATRRFVDSFKLLRDAR